MEGPELLRLVDAIHRERNIDKEQLFQGLEHALLTAARKKLGESAEIFVSIDRETGDVTVTGPGGKRMDLAELGSPTAASENRPGYPSARFAEPSQHGKCSALSSFSKGP